MAASLPIQLVSRMGWVYSHQSVFCYLEMAKPLGAVLMIDYFLLSSGQNAVSVLGMISHIAFTSAAVVRSYPYIERRSKVVKRCRSMEYRGSCIPE